MSGRNRKTIVNVVDSIRACSTAHCVADVGSLGPLVVEEVVELITVVLQKNVLLRAQRDRYRVSTK